MCRILHRLAAQRARNDHFTALVVRRRDAYTTLRKVAAEHDLLGSRRQVGQGIGIDPRGPQAAELDVHIAQCRLRDLGSSSMATAAGRLEPFTCRKEPPPIAAMALSTPGSKLLRQPRSGTCRVRQADQEYLVPEPDLTDFRRLFSPVRLESLTYCAAVSQRPPGRRRRWW